VSSVAVPVRRRALPDWAGSVVGIVSLVALWQLLGATVFADNGAVPPPTAIVSQMVDDGWHFYQPNISTTAREAALGWLWGNVLAVGVAALFVVLPVTERPLMRLAIASYCLPIIAIGPILQIVFAGDAPKVILAALSVFFTTLIGALVGLRAADRTSLDLVHAYGGGGWAKLTKVRAWASLPSLFAGLRIAAPAAILGAIIGEYLGGESGLGIAMINSQQALQVERTWGIALAATAVASLAYGATALVARLLTPWAPRVTR
jgi:ABC-type nitrate/sulfonate/bicarbonate transport system permease component